MERRIIYIIIVVILIIAGTGGISLFSRAPVVSVSGASVSSLNLSTISLDITLSVDNRYPVAIPVRSLKYLVAYQSRGTEIILGEGEQSGIRMDPGIQNITIPLSISNPALVRSILEILKSGEISLQINGTVTPDLFGITPPIPFNREVAVPVHTGTILSGIRSMLVS